jgi:prepilin-type N-terminal cleavage/methylation domain-containing protein/prepilin-type processing-associated H-X9-DG protein
MNRRSRTSRAGLTLVEVLVVIAIIGLLVGLLLPAVQSARESARRANCSSTLRQWGQAMQSYEQSYGVLPLGISEWRCCRHPWVPVLWPYMEQQALADRYNWGWLHFWNSPNSTLPGVSPAGPMSQRLPSYYCPSDRPNTIFLFQGAVVPRVNYVVNSTNVVVSGRKHRGPFHRQFQDGLASYCGPQYVGLSTGNTNGETFVPIDARGYVGPWAWRFSHIVDGLSNTLMMAEAIVWPSDGVAGEPGDPRGQPDYAFFDARITPNSAFDMVRAGAGCNNTNPSLPCQASGDNQNWIFASRSRHMGGVQAMMCDGSVRFVSDMINQAAWQAQGTMNGAEPPSANE